MNLSFWLLVSVPLNDTLPVELRVPAPGTLKFTVTIMVVPLAIVDALQTMVPPLPTAGAVQVPMLVETELNGRPVGNVAVKTTALAGWFCAFLTCQVMVSVVVGPEVGPPFCGDPVTCRSVVVGGCASAVFKLNVLFAGAGSETGFPFASLAFTVAVLVIAAVTFSVTVTVALPPETMDPRLHWNCDPSSTHAPWLGVPELNVAPAGMKSTTVTCGAKLGPRLLAVRV